MLYTSNRCAMMSRCRESVLRSLAGICSAALLAGVTATPAAAQVNYGTVVLSGPTGTSPGLGPNVYFSGFANVSLNDSGAVVFTGSLAGSGTNSGNNLGIFRDSSGSPMVVARTGSVGPGPNLGAGSQFAGFNSQTVAPAIDDAGNVIFSGFFGSSVHSGNTGIFRNAAGSTTLLAASGPDGPGPNLGPGVEFDATSFSSRPLVNGTGQIAFENSLNTGPRRSFSNADGAINALIPPGTIVAPGYTLHPSFPDFRPEGFNDHGTVGLSGMLVGPGSNVERALYTVDSGVITLMARTGVDGPGPNLGPDVTFKELFGPRLNNAGQAVFSGTLQGSGIDSSNDSGVWINTGGARTIIARSGSAGPGPNLPMGTFTSISGPIINSAGTVAFTAAFSDAVGSGTGLFANPDGSFELLARTAVTGPGPGPDAGDGVSFANFAYRTINAEGVIAFAGVLQGTGIDTTNNDGIWCSVDGTLVPIVREGQLFDVLAGAAVELRTIAGVTFETPGGLIGSGGEDGHRKLLNDAGMLTFRLSFTNGTSGIFTAIVPEPASLSCLALAGTAMLARRCRR